MSRLADRQLRVLAECDAALAARRNAANAALANAAARHGFLTADDLAAIAIDTDTRLTPVLVRCGGCRFTAPAQDVEALIGIITREASDYVRDVSLPARA